MELVPSMLGTVHSFYWNWILPEASRAFYGKCRFRRHIMDSIHSKKLDGDIRTSVRHPMWSLILSMGRNQQDIFIKWKQGERRSKSILALSFSLNNNN